MTAQLVQTVSNFAALYELRAEDRLLGTARIGNNIFSGGACECCFSGMAYSLSYNPAQQVVSWFKPRTEKTGVPYQILRNGEKTGEICIKISEGNIFSRYDYFFLELDGRTYEMYPIGMGKEGMKYPIYEDETQVALIEKGTVVRNHLDIYQITVAQEGAILAAYFLCLYLDMREFANRGRIDSNAYEKSYCYTTKKALKEKYNPAFKETV